MSDSNVESNNAANAGILLYAVVMTLGGIGLGVATWFKDWGFMGYLGGAMLLVAGGSMLIGRIKGGLKFVSLSCPRCAHEQTYAEEALDKDRKVPCKSCHEYMVRNASGVHPVPNDAIEAEPTFEAACPSAGMRFAPVCVVCGEASTGDETFEGSTFHSGAVTNKRITRTIEVPVCDAHRGTGAVDIGTGWYIAGDQNFAVRFRSYAARRAFIEANPTKAHFSNASTVTFGRE